MKSFEDYTYSATVRSSRCELFQTEYDGDDSAWYGSDFISYFSHSVESSLILSIEFHLYNQ